MNQTCGQKLSDPKWQRKRLEVMQRDNWKCMHCNATDKTLNVHHRYYKAGVEPWGYPEDCYQTLCKDCHEALHKPTPRSIGINDVRKWIELDKVIKAKRAITQIPIARGVFNG